MTVAPPFPNAPPPPDVALEDPRRATACALVVVTPAAPPVPADRAGADPRPPDPPRVSLLGSRDVRRMTPRQMVDLSLELYAAGVLDWEDYALLAFQPELHPDYDSTIGALTGEPAAPDLPRDFVAHWRWRLDFERRHTSDDPDRLRRTARILKVLCRIDRSADFRG